uniref:Uncharacterized protein n=1 Tax=Glossina austeni TaxID=7395 RepID=A0A1A9VRR6_GLOAU
MCIFMLNNGYLNRNICDVGDADGYSGRSSTSATRNSISSGSNSSCSSSWWLIYICPSIGSTNVQLTEVHTRIRATTTATTTLKWINWQKISITTGTSIKRVVK